MPTLALLGDSILDNRPYVGPNPDTAAVLRELLGGGWTVALLAQDGATIGDTRSQLADLPDTTDVAVLSAGGNDAIQHIGLLGKPARTAAGVLAELREIAETFAAHYRALLAELEPRARRLIVCTIYEPPLSDPIASRLAAVPLALLNDRIVRLAGRHRADVLDLRAVCIDAADYVMEIEPSAAGAAKIARAIHRLVEGTDRSVRYSGVM